MKPAEEFRWLRRIHRFWILPAEMVSSLLVVGAVLAALVLWLLGARQFVGITAGGFVVASVAAAVIQHLLFYRAIRCPSCGHNPNRYKNGRNIPVKTAWTRLRKMEGCPVCEGKAGGAKSAPPE